MAGGGGSGSGGVGGSGGSSRIASHVSPHHLASYQASTTGSSPYGVSCYSPPPPPHLFYFLFFQNKLGQPDVIFDQLGRMLSKFFL